MTYKSYPAKARMGEGRLFAPQVDYAWTLANGSRAQRRRLVHEVKCQNNRSNQARKKKCK
jgi:hypothetical protein